MAKTVQIRVNGDWEDILPQSIKMNDLFRMFDCDGTPFVFPDGNTVQFALEDASVNNRGEVFVAYGALLKF
jgi:hypothetical protein